MPFVLFQRVGSDAAPVSLRAERIIGVSGLDGGGTSVIHVEGGGESFHVMESADVVRARISQALNDPDEETLEKES